MMTTKLQTLINASMMGMIAAVGLSGCVVSDDPVVNGVATAATVGAVATVFYSISDGYYYDSYYQRMPRGYRPAKHVIIHRVDDIEVYRRHHPLDSRRALRPKHLEPKRVPVRYRIHQDGNNRNGAVWQHGHRIVTPYHSQRDVRRLQVKRHKQIQPDNRRPFDFEQRDR